MDWTAENLTGAMILKATRRGRCLDLETTRGRIIVGGNHTFTRLQCLGCGEERLTEIVETAGLREGVCAVCGRSWKL